ncbi:MAG: MarR family transcriptional regulator [Oscillospiraceae bacterium]|nr:MarR family transcriptional regulator [Oscillospiraceae bacterium]
MTDEKIKSSSDAYCMIRYGLYSTYEKYAKKFGLGYKSLFVLRMLYTSPEGCTQNDICRYSVISKQTVSAIMKNYLSNGYISMEEIAYDRRNKLVKLTESGWKYAENIIPLIIKAEYDSMSDFTDEQRVEFLRLSEQYAEKIRNLIK